MAFSIEIRRGFVACDRQPSSYALWLKNWRYGMLIDFDKFFMKLFIKLYGRNENSRPVHNKLRDSSPQANYTDRAIAAGQRS
jgi:hypothetical protein